MSDLLVRAARMIWEISSSPATIATTMTVVAMTALLILYDRLTGRDWRRYFSREFLTDLEYAVFYNAGFFALVWYPIYAVMSDVVKPIGVFSSDNQVLHLALYMVVSDFGLYWKHRLMHALPFLWRIHAIHHSQSRITLMTSYRFHVVDELFSNGVRLVAAMLVGAPPKTWLAATIVMTMYQSLQHADTGWTFGPLDRLLVSSRFHNVHHSADANVSRQNFGLFFSLWDHVFGTARERERPARYGVEDLDVPSSFVSQLFFPFGRRRSVIASAVVPPVPSEQ